MPRIVSMFQTLLRTSLITLLTYAVYYTFRDISYSESFLKSRMSIQPSNQPDGLLTGWFKESLGGFYELSDSSSSTEENFKSIFSKKFLAESRLYLDHEQATLDDFQKRLLESRFAFAKAEVEWKEVVEQGPQDADGNEDSTIVGFFVVTKSMKFRIRAGPAQQLQYSSFSAKIRQSPNAEPQIAELFLTSINKAAPIHF